MKKFDRTGNYAPYTPCIHVSMWSELRYEQNTKEIITDAKSANDVNVVKIVGEKQQNQSQDLGQSRSVNTI